MRITVDIPEEKLKELLDLTGEKKMSPAISKAVQEYIKRVKTSELGKLIKAGSFELKE
jgi:metal-responsive CopG/Arc/MetJ family transcriptional regulator